MDLSGHRLRKNIENPTLYLHPSWAEELPDLDYLEKLNFHMEELGCLGEELQH